MNLKNLRQITLTGLLGSLFLACGQDGEPTPSVVEHVNPCYKDVGDTNNDGQLNTDDCVKIVPVPQESSDNEQPEPAPEVVDSDSPFVGFFALENEGQLELVQLADESFAIVGVQRLVTVNKTVDTLGLLPKLPRHGWKQVDNKLERLVALKYRKKHHKIYNDNGVLIHGKRLTKITFELVDARLTITIIIYEKNGIDIATTLTISEEGQ